MIKRVTLFGGMDDSTLAYITSKLEARFHTPWRIVYHGRRWGMLRGDVLIISGLVEVLEGSEPGSCGLEAVDHDSSSLVPRSQS